jgi:hypothetical protein
MKQRRYINRGAMSQSISDNAEDEMWDMLCPNSIRRRPEPHTYLKSDAGLNKIDGRNSSS